MSEIQCSLHYCSLQYISQIDIHYWQRHAFMVNKQNSLMGLVPYPDYPNTLMSFSSQKAEMKKCNVLSLLSNRCFFLFYLVVQRTMRPKIKAKLFSGTWTCLCFALVDWEKPNKVNKGIIEAFEWYNQDNPKLYISLYRFVWRIFL